MSDAAAKRRARQTLINLLLSLGATIGVVLLLVLAVPRDDSNRLTPVDHIQIAKEVGDQAPGDLITLELDSGWYSNSARFQSAATDGVASWFAGFVGPKSEYVAMLQAFDVNETWLALQLESAKPSGGALIAGTRWQVYRSANPSDPPASKDFIMVHESAGEVILLYGVAPFSAFELIGGKIAAAIGADD